MIAPPRRDQAYPGRLPPVRQQWAQLGLRTRIAVFAGPVVLFLAVAAADLAAAVTITVMIAGMELATAVYVKNRTDRHNGAVDRGEIRVAEDPHLVEIDRDQLPREILDRIHLDGMTAAEVGRVRRFDGGWIVRRRNPRDVALVVGDDGGWARFDPRRVTDLWAVSEYRAGRGHEPL